MVKVLFLIHDLGAGGAEKVLVNLVNNMDYTKFDVTVMALFGGGVYEKHLNPEINYKTVFKRTIRGNSHLMKLLTPKQLHRMFIKEAYDIEISYLEGPSARIVGGCPDKDTKLVSWIHCTMKSLKDVKASFRNYDEAIDCYRKFDTSVFVSSGVREAFLSVCPIEKEALVLFNTNESEKIIKKSKELVGQAEIKTDAFNWCGVGKLVPNKGFDRMLRVHTRLLDAGYNVHFYVLGAGPKEEELKKWCRDNQIEENVTFLGFQENPYKYIAKCDLYVCASYAEGFSTAATEALIVGTPVCTVEVSGMKEMLGADNEFGIVTDNNEEALYKGIKALLDNPKLLEHYKKRASERGKSFSTENTVNAVETMLLDLVKEKK